MIPCRASSCTADSLFILILVELFRLLIIYLQEQRVSIGVSVEIAIVSVLREVIVNGVLETDWQQIVAVCLFLATAGLLMVVRVWLPPTFEGVNPEAQVSARIRMQKPHDWSVGRLSGIHDSVVFDAVDCGCDTLLP